MPGRALPSTASLMPIESSQPRLPPRRSARKAPSTPPPEQTDDEAIQQIDTRFLQTLVGYGARRVSLTAIASFLPRMAAYELRPVEFSVLSLIHHNPGITSRQLCGALN